jgi:hypothetical protein
MDELLHEFATSISEFDEAEPDFNNAYGILTVEQNQAGLKKILWSIDWLNAEGGAEHFGRNFYLHEDSMYWEQYGLRDFSYFSPNDEGQE